MQSICIVTDSPFTDILNRSKVPSRSRNPSDQLSASSVFNSYFSSPQSKHS